MAAWPPDASTTNHPPSSSSSSSSAIVIRPDEKGLRVTVYGNEPNKAIVLECCEQCVLFRSERNAEVRCFDWSGTHQSYSLDPLDTGDIKLYRESIVIQASGKQKFFQEKFLEVLHMYPQLSHEDFYVKISIKIEKELGVKVVDVELDVLNDSDRKLLKPLEGKVVLAFNIKNVNGEVQFEVEMHVPLKQEKLPKSDLRWQQANYTGALQIMEKLSDEVEEGDGRNISWKPSSDFLQIYKTSRQRGLKSLALCYKADRIGLKSLLKGPNGR